MSGQQLGFIVSRCLAVAVALHASLLVPLWIPMIPSESDLSLRFSTLLPIVLQAFALLFLIGYLWSNASRFCPEEDSDTQVRIPAESVAFVLIVMLGTYHVLRLLADIAEGRLRSMIVEIGLTSFLPAAVGLALLLAAIPIARYLARQGAV